MPKIVIDGRESGTSTGRYVDKLIENLHKLRPDFEVVVLTKSPRLKFMEGIAPNFKVIESDFKEFTFSEQLGFLRQLKKLKPDLVHFTMTQQPISYSGKKITTMHDLTTLRFDNPAKNPAVFKTKQKIYGRLVKSVAKKSVYIITGSRYVKQDVAQYANVNPSKIFVTYEAADKIPEPAKALPILRGKRYIMYVGRATPHKNLKRLIDAFELLKRSQPDLMLVLAGKTDANYKKLSATVSHKRLADSIVFTDFIEEGELRWLYENTAAYVFPSLSEGFGLPGLEAMVHGAPLVSSKTTCLPEIYGEAAHYFNPRDTDDMALKINDVLSKPALRTQLIQEGRARAAKYSWGHMARQTLEIYRKALQPKKH